MQPIQPKKYPDINPGINFQKNQSLKFLFIAIFSN